MKDQNQKSDQEGTGKFGQKNPQSSPTSGANLGKSPPQSAGRGQGSSSYGQQTGGNYGKTPDARKGNVSGNSSISGQQEGQHPRNEKLEDKPVQKDLEKLTDPDHTKGPERSDIDPVSKQNQSKDQDRQAK